MVQVIYQLGPFKFEIFSSIITKAFLQLYIYSIQDLFDCLYIMFYLVKVKYTIEIMCTPE